MRTESRIAVAFYMAMMFGGMFASDAQAKPPTRHRLRVTAYCDRGLTASGRLAGPGQCAAPAWVPFGSRVTIPGQGTYVVTDRTHKRFRHNTVDVWRPTRRECLRNGVAWKMVTIRMVGR